MADKVTVTLVDGMHFNAYTTAFDEPIPFDSDPEVGGLERGHRPLEMLLTGLGGCMAMDAVSILRKKRQEFSQFEVTFQTEQNTDHPHYYTVINMHFTVGGVNVSEEALARALELSFTRYCSAAAMLKDKADIRYTYEIIDVPESVAS